MYGRLASRYDNDVRDQFSVVCAKTSAQHLQTHGISPPAEILDLACGTGLTAIQLQEMGYQVTGVDSSDDMLALAGGRKSTAAERPRFLKGDIRALPEIGPFSAALCFGDVLNHLIDSRDIVAMLASVFSVLRPGGWLICDTNSLDTFRSKMWNTDLPPNFWKGMRLRTRCFFDEEDGLGHMECQVFEMGEEIKVYHLTERYHCPETMTGWLSQAGFVEVGAQPYHPLDLSELYPEIGILKTLWTCQKPLGSATG